MAWAVYLNETSLASLGVYVMRLNSHTSGPSRSYPTVALPGRQGVVLNADPEMGARTLSIQATISTNSVAARATAEDQLKALAYAGAIAIGVDDDVNAPRRIIGVCQGCDVSQRAHPVDAIASDVSLSFLCPDPTWSDVVGQVIGFSATASPIPVGTAPSGGIVRLSAPVWSANVTNPVLTYRNAAGVVVQSLTFNTTLAAGTDYLEIDLDRQTVVEYQSGVARNAIGDITAGAFFALDPMDGDPLNASYPSLEVTSSAGTPSGQYLGHAEVVVMATLFPSRAFRRTKERASGLLFSFGGDDLSTVLTTGQTLSLTRASGRTVFDSAGRIAHVGYGCPAWSSVYNAEAGIWEPTLDIQNQSTNLVLRSEDFSAGWSSVGTPTRTSAAAVCGDLVLDLIGDDASGTLEGFTRSVSLTGNTQKGVSVFMKAGTSTTTVVRLRDTSASATRAQMTITWSSGVPTVTATTGTDVGTLACYNGVYRFRFQSNSCTAANAHQIEIYPATNAALANSQTGTVYVGGVQVEDFGTPTAYIKTLGSTVTRAKDYYPTTIAFGVQDLTVYVRTVFYAGINGAAFWLGAGGVNSTLFVVRNGGDTVATVVDGGGSNRSAQQTTPSTSVFEYAAQFVDLATGPRCRIDVGGGFSSYSTAGTPLTAWGSSTLLLGSSTASSTGTDALNSGVRRVIIAPGARTLAEMQGLAV